jgi:hypothetical protein
MKSLTELQTNLEKQTFDYLIALGVPSAFSHLLDAVEVSVGPRWFPGREKS